MCVDGMCEMWIVEKHFMDFCTKFLQGIAKVNPIKFFLQHLLCLEYHQKSDWLTEISKLKYLFIFLILQILQYNLQKAFTASRHLLKSMQKIGELAIVEMVTARGSGSGVSCYTVLTVPPATSPSVFAFWMRMMRRFGWHGFAG